MRKEDQPGISPPSGSVSLEKAEEIKRQGFDVMVEDGRVRIVPSKIRIVPPGKKKEGEEIIPFPKK